MTFHCSLFIVLIFHCSFLFYEFLNFAFSMFSDFLMFSMSLEFRSFGGLEVWRVCEMFWTFRRVGGVCCCTVYNCRDDSVDFSTTHKH